MRDIRGNAGDGVTAPIITREVHELLAEFDALPRAYREIVRDCAYNIAVERLTTLSPRELRVTLRRVVRNSVLATYGPDNPQAK